MTRHVWDVHKEQVGQDRLSAEGKAIYQRRKQTVERSFADAKELCRHRYAKYRGLKKVKGQCLMAAAPQNINKIARWLNSYVQKSQSGQLNKLVEDLFAPENFICTSTTRIHKCNLKA